MIAPASTNGGKARGRPFEKGNPGGPGNPFIKRVAKLRATLLKAVTPKEMRQVVEALIAKAKSGDVPAIKELLDRTIGKPQQSVSIVRDDGEMNRLPPSREDLEEMLIGRARSLTQSTSEN